MSSTVDFTEFYKERKALQIERDFKDNVMRSLPGWSTQSLADAWAIGEWPSGKDPSPDKLWNKDYVPGEVRTIDPTVYQQITKQPVMYNVGEKFIHPPMPGECS